jgi:5-methylcytosine-specific restriction endonuclease McrA
MTHDLERPTIPMVAKQPRAAKKLMEAGGFLLMTLVVSRHVQNASKQTQQETMRKKIVGKKTAKKAPSKKRQNIDRPFCNQTWTIARMRGFVMSALRGARWNPRMTVINRAFVRKDINPATGKLCSIHRCEECLGEFPQGKMKADHREPVIPLDHDWEANPDHFLGYNWSEVMRRLWIEKGEGWNVICEECHNAKTSEERTQRTEFKKQKKQSNGTEESTTAVLL